MRRVLFVLVLAASSLAQAQVPPSEVPGACLDLDTKEILPQPQVDGWYQPVAPYLVNPEGDSARVYIPATGDTPERRQWVCRLADGTTYVKGYFGIFESTDVFTIVKALVPPGENEHSLYFSAVLVNHFDGKEGLRFSRLDSIPLPPGQ